MFFVTFIFRIQTFHVRVSVRCNAKLLLCSRGFSDDVVRPAAMLGLSVAPRDGLGIVVGNAQRVTPTTLARHETHCSPGCVSHPRYIYPCGKRRG